MCIYMQNKYSLIVIRITQFVFKNMTCHENPNPTDNIVLGQVFWYIHNNFTYRMILSYEDRLQRMHILIFPRQLCENTGRHNNVCVCTIHAAACVSVAYIIFPLKVKFPSFIKYSVFTFPSAIREQNLSYGKQAVRRAGQCTFCCCEPLTQQKH